MFYTQLHLKENNGEYVKFVLVILLVILILSLFVIPVFADTEAPDGGTGSGFGGTSGGTSGEGSGGDLGGFNNPSGASTQSQLNDIQYNDNGTEVGFNSATGSWENVIGTDTGSTGSVGSTALPGWVYNLCYPCGATSRVSSNESGTLIWSCIACSPPPPPPGACGAAATNYDLAVTEYSGLYCDPGDSSPVLPDFPVINGTVTWTCQVSNSGAAPADCSATRLAECFDTEDNDNDGFADFAGAGVFPRDPSCDSPEDDDETNLVQCVDGYDNDNDGTADFAGTVNADGTVDLPLDPSCLDDPGNDDETLPPQCSDGRDNTDPEDTDVDYNVDTEGNYLPGSDLGCSSAADNDETDPVAFIFVEAEPNLVKSPGDSTFTWRAEFITSCKVYKNGTEAFSSGDIEPYTVYEDSIGASGITEETTFTLKCTDFSGNEVTASDRVNILPTFEEF